MDNYTLDLTKEQATVLAEYLLRKISKLEEAGLKDSKCYKALYPIYLSLITQTLNTSNTEEVDSEISNYKAMRYKRGCCVGNWSVEVVREKDDRAFWVDVELDSYYKDIVADWNQYIFNGTDEDLARRAIQENSDECTTATAEAICFLETVGEIFQDDKANWFISQKSLKNWSENK